MSEIINNNLNDVNTEKLSMVMESLNKLNNKKSKFLFCIPESQNPVASVYELYFHATVVKRMGFDVYILVENDGYKIPDWIETELTDFKHLPMTNTGLNVGAEDFIIIPEVFTNVMEHVKTLPCHKIAFVQSLDYMYNSLLPGIDLSLFNIRDIITTSQILKETLENFYGVNKFNIYTYNIGIPDYFKKSDLPQKPIISIIGRNPNEISKFVKLFYSKYPHYNWISFDPMLTKSKPPQQMRRIDFANRLRENFAAVWIDRISNFGTFPLECMKSGVIPICLLPDIVPEYIIERNEENKPVKIKDNVGIWTNNFYDLPIITGELITKFLDDNIEQSIYTEMDLVASKYTQEESQKMLIDLYTSFINQRKMLFESALNNNNNE